MSELERECVCVYVLEFVVYSLLVFSFLLFLFCQFDFFVVVVEREMEKRDETLFELSWERS